MRSPTSRSFLEKMLEDGALEESDLRTLAALEEEDLYVEFKDGKELGAHKKAARDLRQFVSGFANSDGGLLIIGMADKKPDDGPRPFTKTTRPGGKPLNEWAVRCLADLAGQGPTTTISNAAGG